MFIEVYASYILPKQQYVDASLGKRDSRCELCVIRAEVETVSVPDNRPATSGFEPR